jgi:hypothetical protein
MNEDLYDYSELKDDITCDVQGYMSGANFSFEQAVGTIIYELIELANPHYEEDDSMIYTILMLICIENNNIIDQVKNEMTQIINENKMEKLKMELREGDYNAFIADINSIKPYIT